MRAAFSLGVVNDSGSGQSDDRSPAAGSSPAGDGPGAPAPADTSPPADTPGPDVTGTGTRAVPAPRDDSRRLSPALIATLVTIPVVVLTFFIVVAALKPDAEANPVASLAAPGSSSTECAALVDALPDRFDGFSDKKTSDDGLVRYTSSDGDIVLRCGVDRPAGLAPTSNLQVVNPVQWFMTDTRDGSGQAYVSVDRRPYVALWLPVNAGNAPITDISAIISKTLPMAPLDFG
ncbi:DUF3515 family protein [Gordonia pseudamarae]|uniref:DUF3515 family protein n=1 Tax=Gordonia pseudamarae TaxID=2831662 RepID=A0ABX6IJ20_9ACTN|nr:DUF3515 domain-containing protein [Gordonia sp. (in: high G+C Gram-positive bacteria)]QHN26999.1 DUF3515 family protein [Gordonia pseudamarae]QHN35888.1 DUF3515 family protein [Gordonia pseudamarae]